MSIQEKIRNWSHWCILTQGSSALHQATSPYGLLVSVLAPSGWDNRCPFCPETRVKGCDHSCPIAFLLTVLPGLLSRIIISSLLGDLPLKHRGVALSKFTANLQYRKPYKSEELWNSYSEIHIQPSRAGHSMDLNHCRWTLTLSLFNQPVHAIVFLLSTYCVSSIARGTWDVW